MEDRSRNFEPVQVGMVSAETAQARYPKKSDKQAPAIAYWRINLTALSQRHNLYFIATRDTVQIYRPKFPYQTLGHTPTFTIKPHLANPAAYGYIDTRQPHSINHLIVGDLGNQEILLLSTDSGNVVAYYTGSVNAAIEKNVYNVDSSEHVDLVSVQPFFSQWVHESAWGLAIHKEGRMIAVSANTPYHSPDFDSASKVTVFAFALTRSNKRTETTSLGRGDGRSTSVDSGEWEIWSASKVENGHNFPNRDRNYKIVLGGHDGHQYNVPCVAFVNSSEDIAGSWLLSTDIKGRMKIWQIWKGRCLRTWDFNQQGELATPWTHHRESGWLIAALDINAFRPAESMGKFIGNHRAPQYYGYHSSGDSYDLTNTVRRYTPQNNLDHPFIASSDDDDSSEEERDELNNEPIDEEGEVQSTSSIHPSRLLRNRMVPNSVRSPTATVEDEHRGGQLDNDPTIDETDEEEAELFAQAVEDAMEFEFDDDFWDDDDIGDVDGNISADLDVEDRPPQSLESSASSLSYTTGNNEQSLSRELHTVPLSSATTLKMLSQLIKARMELPVPARQSSEKDSVTLPQVPILHCSNSHVRLFRGPMAQHPHIFCAKMLRQNLPPELEEANFAHFDRLCMVHQIPELGIVVIATQLGRCAVCSLTKRSKDGLLGFRVDWILPTKKQERRSMRPANCVLLGIAASPIQGHEELNAQRVSRMDSPGNWAKDRIIDGTKTTFDPKVVVLGSRGQKSVHDNSVTGQDSNDANIQQEARQWVKPGHSETWSMYESSRRYRLMLTYSDHSVLTYELSRGVEREDIAMESNLDSLD